MTWLRIDDQVAFHEKTVAAGHRAFGAWVCMAAWSASQMKDGFVPQAVATGLLRVTEEDLARLVAVRFLDVAEGGYQVHDFLAYNPSRAQVVAERERKSAGGKQGAEKRWGDARAKAPPMGPPMGAPIVHPSEAACSRPDPGPIPIPVPGEREHSLTLAPTDPKPGKVVKAKQTKSHVPSSDASAADVQAWCSRWAIPSPSSNAEVVRMLDHFRGKGEAKADWGATWRNWERRAVDFARTGSGIGAKRERDNPQPTSADPKDRIWKPRAPEGMVPRGPGGDHADLDREVAQ